MRNLTVLITITIFCLTFQSLHAQSSMAPRSSVSFGRALLDAENLIKSNPEWEMLGVKGGSMKPLLGENSLIVFRPIAAESVQAGMLVVFMDQDGDRVVHQAVSQDETGWTTKGIKNWKNDPDKVTDGNLLGAVVAVMHSKDAPRRQVFTGTGRPLEFAMGKRY